MATLVGYVRKPGSAWGDEEVPEPPVVSESADQFSCLDVPHLKGVGRVRGVGDHLPPIRGESCHPSAVERSDQFGGFRLPNMHLIHALPRGQEVATILRHPDNTKRLLVGQTDVVEGMDDWRISLDLRLLF